MTLPFIIGEDSANEAVFADFEQLPHLFVSYSDEAQIHGFVSSLTKSLQNNPQCVPVRYALALSQNSGTGNLQFSNHGQLSYCFIQGDEMMSNVNSRQKFMQAIAKEMRERSNILKKQDGIKPGQRKYMPHMVIFFHDVFDIILSSKKLIAQTFLQLLILGKSLKMHVLAASGATYRMLLRQLVYLNPCVMKKFSNLFAEGQFNMKTPLGAELVITAEDLIFFKQANAGDYQRLYPVRKKIYKPGALTAKMDMDLSLTY